MITVKKEKANCKKETKLRKNDDFNMLTPDLEASLSVCVIQLAKTSTKLKLNRETEYRKLCRYHEHVYYVIVNMNKIEQSTNP